MSIYVHTVAGTQHLLCARCDSVVWFVGFSAPYLLIKYLACVTQAALWRLSVGPCVVCVCALSISPVEHTGADLTWGRRSGAKGL